MTSNLQPSSNNNQLISWMNEVGMCEGARKSDLLRKITETLLHQKPHLIPEYLEKIMSYVSNKSTDVKKTIVIFIEELSKLHPNYIVKVISYLQVLLADSVIAIQKRVIQAAGMIYKYMLTWMCKMEEPIADLEYIWKHLNNLKLCVLNMIDSDNEGIRTYSIKFLEGIILMQTSNEDYESDDEFLSLDMLPKQLHFVNKNELEQESEHIFSLLIEFQNSQHISSVNLMACMSSLSIVARHRPKYMNKVLQALTDLKNTLPPTLSQSQLNSVKKHLKMLLMNMMKNTNANTSQYVPRMVHILTELGVGLPEINKALPKEKRFKRLPEVKLTEVPAKRLRIDITHTDEDIPMVSTDAYTSEVQITEESIFEGLKNIDNVTELVTYTLKNSLPSEMPSSFATLYKPIPYLGTARQKRVLAGMLHNIIKGEDNNDEKNKDPDTKSMLASITSKLPIIKTEEDKITLKNAVAKLQETTKSDKQVENALTKLMGEVNKDDERLKEKTVKQAIIKPKPKIKLLMLNEITRPLPKDIKEKLIIQAITRILNADKDASIAGASQIRTKLISLFASSYTPELRDLVLSYIIADPTSRIDLAITWLYEEYAYMQSFNRHPVTLQPRLTEKHDQNYNQLLCALLTQICECPVPEIESTRDVFMRKIFTEAPILTDEAIAYLQYQVTDPKISMVAIDLVEEICITRPPRAHKYIKALLGNVLCENDDIRENCITSIVKVYKNGPEAVIKVIEKYAKLYLGFIAMNSPPMDLFPNESRLKRKWSDDLFKLCLNLILALYPVNEDIMIEVARVYGQSKSEAKRSVLRCIEIPVRMVANTEPRPAFLRLLDECPRGSETLLTRLMHIFTEKCPPTPELVYRVRSLYSTRVSDVRFLIPVLNGLTKKEILAALPTLIKLNPVVVKEVFNKLLGLQNPNEEYLPVSPVELFVTLHLIEIDKADLKFIIKACAICFSEKQIYTQEVISVALQQLMQETTIPVLMMRSVLQALTLYPALSGLVLNILQRLIEKEVWDNKVAWEGWIKCCERTVPASCSVLLSLPAAPLAACISSTPALAEALKTHIASMTPVQKAQLPPQVLSEIMITSSYAMPVGVPPPIENEIDINKQWTNSDPGLEPLPPGMEL